MACAFPARRMMRKATPPDVDAGRYRILYDGGAGTPFPHQQRAERLTRNIIQQPKEYSMITILKLMLVMLVLAGNPALAGSLTVAAASDLKFAMDDLVREFRKAHPETQVDVVLGSSGKFYQQIVSGAPFDLFFSADIDYPRLLEEQKLTASDIQPYAVGRIVLWSSSLDASRMTLDSLKESRIRHIAIANPKHAPYGKRAQEALEKAGLWKTLHNKLVYGETIAHTAQYVESGAADVGIVALSLAIAPTLSGKGGYFPIPDTLHLPLEQAFVLLSRAAGNPDARAFADYVASPAARALFERYGFALPEKTAQ
jgi:molybdate transport system substrate-binding protein